MTSIVSWQKSLKMSKFHLKRNINMYLLYNRCSKTDLSFFHQLMSSALFPYCSLQATWSTVLHMTMSSTTDGPLELPAGHTCLWRISNPTLGNTQPPGVCVYITVCACVQCAWRGVDVSACTFTFSDPRYHLAHGSHRKQKPELTNRDLLGCKIPDLHVMFKIRLLPRVQVLGCGSGVFVFMLGSVYIIIPSSCGYLCVSSCMHV